jgi:hypothetical protein
MMANTSISSGEYHARRLPPATPAYSERVTEQFQDPPVIRVQVFTWTRSCPAPVSTSRSYGAGSSGQETRCPASMHIVAMSMGPALRS